MGVGLGGSTQTNMEAGDAEGDWNGKTGRMDIGDNHPMRLQ
jgi:hypothetical protein